MLATKNLPSTNLDTPKTMSTVEKRSKVRKMIGLEGSMNCCIIGENIQPTKTLASNR